MSLFRLSQSCDCLPSGDYYYKRRRKASKSGAFESNEVICAHIILPQIIGAINAEMLCFDECGNKLFSYPLKWYSKEAGNDIYKLSLPKKKLSVGLYFYSLKILSTFGDLYAYPSEGKLKFAEKIPDQKLQISISDFKYEKPSGLYGGIIYHIFVDRFCRGGKITPKDGAVLVEDWTAGVPEFPEYPGASFKNNTFYGGTLEGIRKKLHYIKSLGTTAIYLSPIFDAASNHKYDTGDYMTVDSMFGGDKALKRLIKDADALNIKIILDGVFNHTGSDSKYFNRYNSYDSLGAYNSESSPYFKWYDFKNHPNEYTSWWGIEILPRINPDIPDCREYFTAKNGVIDKYAKMGVHGFRLDVVDELSDSFVKAIKSRLNTRNSSSVLYGEVWEDASNKIAYDTRKTYYLGDELDGVMNYPLRKGIIEYIKYSRVDALQYALTDIVNNAPKRIRDLQMNLLGTHDTERILTVLGGQDSTGKANSELSKLRMTPTEREAAILRLKSAYTVLATLPGVPVIFYGDEAGLEGYNDPFNRLPYPWGAEEDELILHYRKLGRLRDEFSVYKEGDFELLYLDTDLLVFSRIEKSFRYVTVFNNSERSLDVNYNGKTGGLLNIGRTLLPGVAEVFKINRKSHLYLDFKN